MFFLIMILFHDFVLTQKLNKKKMFLTREVTQYYAMIITITIIIIIIFIDAN